MVSRKHAELRWEGGRWYLYDLNSSYGTYYNGQEPAAADCGGRQFAPVRASGAVDAGCLV